MSMKKRRRRLEKVRDIVKTFEGLSFEEKNPDNSGGNESRTACYRYERKRDYVLRMLRPYLKLEMGYRGGPEPSEIQMIQSYVGQELEKAGQSDLAEDGNAFGIRTLHPKRTFVEKIFAIHAAAVSHQVREKWRHYYDVYRLFSLPDVRTFIGTSQNIDTNDLIFGTRPTLDQILSTVCTVQNRL